ncbi:MAG: 50S ribosomal protein L32 [Anaerolineae bacterium]|nr:50S ribosomal protein L32 [Anaerolineae bacterium]MCO5190750.1 50S ribosomal protein L32 [Anaerolineae bacterium]MCO5192706.1 50S ribosomal protein L32 [Anaerolineae bacterium]MCO5197782.1 50S ribosomal protein L32 [Anaerolineae bacterium]MCO5207321.1 50S ribosomal protein L32 [Anaerolineae bacterium]
MAVPKRKMSRTRRDRRRAHDRLQTTQLVACNNCGVMKLPHVMCPSCRTYRGRQILPEFEEE